MSCNRVGDVSRLWKFWASEELALEICKRDIYSDVDYMPDDFFLRRCWAYFNLAKILKKEWFR